MTDDQFITALEERTLPEDQFHHVSHVRAAWVYLTRYSPLEAMAKFSDALRGYAAFLGKPDRYHQTITWAYLLLVNERIYQSRDASDWQSFAAAHADLLDWNPSILSKYYCDATLQSDRARAVFVMPDRVIT